MEKSNGGALISIRPPYADAILDGDKTIELRRKLPRIAIGTKLWIYATLPKGAVVGFATISKVTKAHPDIIWRVYRDQLGVERSAYVDYLRKSDVAVAIELVAAKRVQPITIKRLRDNWPEFHPPQVLRRLAIDEIKLLNRMCKTKGRSSTVIGTP